MKEPDRDEFRKAVKSELTSLKNANMYSVQRQSQVPKGTRFLPMVWQMRRKHDQVTGKVRKYKARLNIDGSRMRKGVDYSETYAPVTTWATVRLMLILLLVHGWHSCQIDYVSAFPQAPIERPTFTKIPVGMQVDGNPLDYCLEMHKNLYGQKQAGRVWYDFLASKLTLIGFRRSTHDHCVFFRGSCVYVLYTDDTILFGATREVVNEVI